MAAHSTPWGAGCAHRDALGRRRAWTARQENHAPVIARTGHQPLSGTGLSPGSSEETEARLPEIFGGSSVALARTLKIIESGERRIQPAEWDRAFRIFDLLI